VGAVLAHGGHHVTLLLRPETMAVHPDRLTLESPLGAIHAPVARATTLGAEVDMLWIATKATQLEAALASVPAAARARTVVPLLNGVDHVARLRERFGAAVAPATIACESERTAPGRIVHRSPFARLAFLTADEERTRPAVEVLRAFGCEGALVADEATLLWRKLVLLAPVALTTSAAQRTIGEVRDDPVWRARLEALVAEACAVAVAESAAVDAAAALRAVHAFPAPLRSSMSKDVAAGRKPELDAIAGPILRGGRRHGVAVQMTEELATMVARAGRGAP
jgi:2-dehydropantoate 2-reductase